MIIETWWQFCLTQQFPLQDKKLWVRGENFRPSLSPLVKWPEAVARDALFDDFEAWFQERLIKNWNERIRRPDCPDRNAFFVVMSRFLYPRGRRFGSKNYNIIKRVQYQGRWQEVKARRYFVRLCDLQEHINIFEANTGHGIFEVSQFPQEALTGT